MCLMYIFGSVSLTATHTRYTRCIGAGREIREFSYRLAVFMDKNLCLRKYKLKV